MKAERIDGSITGKKCQKAIDQFQAEEVEGKEASSVMLLLTCAGRVVIVINRMIFKPKHGVIILGKQKVLKYTIFFH
eukprot:11590105-Ditylum_brightwellii.AAC.1